MHPRIPFLLKNLLTPEEIAQLPRSYDIIGDILIFSEFPELSAVKERAVGKAYLEAHQQVKTVLKKVGKFSGEFRKPKFKIIAGQRRKTTVHKENGVALALHVENTYFSPRTATERMRIIEQINPSERVLVMFSGIGPFPIEIAKHKKPKLIVAVEKNPEAHHYALENAVRNKVTVDCRLGDVKRVVPRLRSTFDRIIMPLPKNSSDFLDVALTRTASTCKIHIYRFCKEGEEDQEARRLSEIIENSEKHTGLIKWFHCGQYGPGIFRTCFDVKVY